MTKTTLNRLPVLMAIPFATAGSIFLWLGLIAFELVLLLVGFGVATFFYQYFLKRSEAAKAAPVWLLMVVLGLLIGLYRPDSFNYPLLFKVGHLHDNGLPFSFYLNTAKTLAGYIAVVALIALPIVGTPFLRKTSGRIFTVLFLSVLLILVAYLTLDLDVHLKEIKFVVFFSLVNLLATCVSEEAFMRLIFQREITRFLNHFSHNKWIVEGLPLFVTTILFTATHIGPSIEITLVYSLAGFFYGLIYLLTKSFWYSVVCHFLVNFIHFTFLTYPIF